MAEKNTGAEVLAGCGTFLVALPFMIAINALAIKYGWNSVMVPTFDLVAINGYQAFGLSVITHYLTHQQVPNDENKKKMKFIDSIVYDLVKGFARPLLFMLCIWLLLAVAGPEIGTIK
jgi:hypothetical protein